MFGWELNFRYLSYFFKESMKSLVIAWFGCVLLFSQTTKRSVAPTLIPQPINAQTIAQKAIQATAYIKIFDSNKIPISTGSGFLLSDRFVITNYHVIEGGSSGVISFPNVQSGQSIVRIRALSKEHDLAILELDTPVKGISLNLANEGSVSIGNKIYTCGNSLGIFQATFSDGIVSGLRTDGTTQFVQVTAPISPGNSGGPCLNDIGEVIGVVSSTYRGGQNINMAIDILHVKQLLASNTALIVYSSLFPEVVTKSINPREVDEFIKIMQIEYDSRNCAFTMRIKNISSQTIRVYKIMVIWTDSQGEIVDYNVGQPNSVYGYCEILPKLTKETTTLAYTFCQHKGAVNYQVKILEMR